MQTTGISGENSLDHLQPPSVGFLDCANNNNLNNNNCSSDYSENLKFVYSKFPIQLWKSFGIYDDSIFKTVNPHWLKFNVPSSTTHTILAIIYGIIMSFGILGNLFALIVFCRCRSLRTPANYLVLNLTISDFMLLVKIPIFIINSIYRGPVMGPLACQFYGFIGGLAGTASIMTLTMIAIDRYHVIVHPLNPFKKTTHRRALLMICFVWIYSVTFAVVPLFQLGGYVPEGLLTSCSFDYLESSTENRIFIFVYFIAAWLIPLTMIIFSYTSIFRMVLQAEKFSEFQHDGNSRISRRKSSKNRESRMLRKEWKITIVTTIIVLCWVLAWTPYAVVALLGIFGQEHLITPLISAIPALFCKTAACIDPFIYSLSHPKFKREVQKIPLLSSCLKCGRRRTFHPDTSSHYYSATCLAKSEDMDNQQITLHSLPDSNLSSTIHQRPTINPIHVVLISSSTDWETKKQRSSNGSRLSHSLHDMRQESSSPQGGLTKPELNKSPFSCDDDDPLKRKGTPPEEPKSQMERTQRGRKHSNGNNTFILERRSRSTIERRRSLPLTCGFPNQPEDSFSTSLAQYEGSEPIPREDYIFTHSLENSPNSP